MSQVKSELEKLGLIVRKCWGTESRLERDQSGEYAEIVSIINQPVYILRDSDGQEYTWIQELTRTATADETIDFWRNRAKKLEDLQAQMQATLANATMQLLERTEELMRLKQEWNSNRLE